MSDWFDNLDAIDGPLPEEASSYPPYTGLAVWFELMEGATLDEVKARISPQELGEIPQEGLERVTIGASFLKRRPAFHYIVKHIPHFEGTVRVFNALLNHDVIRKRGAGLYLEVFCQTRSPSIRTKVTTLGFVAAFDGPPGYAVAFVKHQKAHIQLNLLNEEDLDNLLVNIAKLLVRWIVEFPEALDLFEHLRGILSPSNHLWLIGYTNLWLHSGSYDLSQRNYIEAVRDLGSVLHLEDLRTSKEMKATLLKMALTPRLLNSLWWYGLKNDVGKFISTSLLKLAARQSSYNLLMLLFGIAPAKVRLNYLVWRSSDRPKGWLTQTCENTTDLVTLDDLKEKSSLSITIPDFRGHPHIYCTKAKSFADVARRALRDPEEEFRPWIQNPDASGPMEDNGEGGYADPDGVSLYRIMLPTGYNRYFVKDGVELMRRAKPGDHFEMKRLTRSPKRLGNARSIIGMSMNHGDINKKEHFYTLKHAKVKLTGRKRGRSLRSQRTKLVLDLRRTCLAKTRFECRAALSKCQSVPITLNPVRKPDDIAVRIPVCIPKAGPRHVHRNAELLKAYKTLLKYGISK